MDRRLTTILAADMVGYSRLMAADEEGVIARLRAARAEVIDPAIAEAGGRIVKTMGDGLLVEFPSALAAVRMAVDVQTAMQTREAGRAEADRFRFRIGINAGEIVVDGEDVLGDCVNIAARLESLAPPGGVCIGRAAHDEIEGRIEVPLTALGPQMVKNIPDPVEVWRVEIAGVEAPKRTGKSERPSIAVLPFDNMSADPDQEFLADGIVEDVITELSRFRSLLVIARNSTFAYKGGHKDVRQIARELDVRYVVEGSVRRAGRRLRVTAQLIEAKTGAHVWAERWDRGVDDLFDLQDELTGAIVAGIEPGIGAHERDLARRRPTESLSAWELAQRAVAAYHRYTSAAIDEAIALAERAVAADPELVAAHAIQARALLSRALGAATADRAADLEAALAAAKQAVEIDPRSDEALWVLGFALSVARRLRESIPVLERALALNPNNASTRLHLAVNLLHPGFEDPARALGEARAALRLNPGDPFAWTYHAMAAVAEMQLGDYAAAERTLDVARAYRGVDWKPALAAALAAVLAGEEDRAPALIEEALAIDPALTAALARHSLPMAFEIARFQPALERLVALGLPRE